MYKKILLLFRTPLHEYNDVYLGTKDYILSLPCKAHSRLFAEVLTDRLYPDFYQSSIGEIYVFKLGGERAVAFRGEIDSGGNIYSSYSHLLSSSRKLGLKSTAQIVHPQWIKHGLPRRWKEHCDCHHGAQCRRVPLAAFLTRDRPKWLIDVWRSCLVPGSLGAEYVALSYVWGERKFITTTRTTLIIFKDPGRF